MGQYWARTAFFFLVMSYVILSDELVKDAQLHGMVFGRSVSDQIEHWASLGKTFEGIVGLEKALQLAESGTAKTLPDDIREIGTAEGEQRLKEYLAGQPFPHFEGVPGKTDEYIRVEEDGSRTIGRFAGGEFVQV